MNNSDLSFGERLLGLGESIQQDGLPKPTIELEFDLINMAMVAVFVFVAILLAMVAGGFILGLNK